MSVSILIGDCLERMREMPDASVDSVVTDPPYHLTSIVKRFGAGNAAPAKVAATGVYARASKGFMGQTWDGGDIAFRPETWAEVLRVLKPGGHIVAFAATRGGHRMACAIEDAGFEIRDCLGWVFGSGFPKSLNVSKKLADSLPADALCACAPDYPQTAPDFQSDCQTDHGSDGGQPSADLADGQDGFLSLSDAPKHNPSPLRADDPDAAASHSRSSSSGLRSNADLQPPALHQLGDSRASDSESCGTPSNMSNVELMAEHKTVRHTPDTRHSDGGSASSSSDNSGCDSSNLPRCEACGKIVITEGLGTSLKPAWEMIYLARKPLIGTVAANVLSHGTGALNIDGCRIEAPGEEISNHGHSAESGKGKNAFGVYAGIDPHQKPGQLLGRWPANVIHDGSDEVRAGFPVTESGSRSGSYANGTFSSGEVSRDLLGDSGSASRFFYCAKAATEERGEGNNHPTVKPIDLMRWLCRLVTPKGGTILDPFAGSGSTLIAADAEQFNAIGCELSPEYAAIAERRVRNAAGLFA